MYNDIRQSFRWKAQHDERRDRDCRAQSGGWIGGLLKIVHVVAHEEYSGKALRE